MLPRSWICSPRPNPRRLLSSPKSSIRLNTMWGREEVRVEMVRRRTKGERASVLMVCVCVCVKIDPRWCVCGFEEG